MPSRQPPPLPLLLLLTVAGLLRAQAPEAPEWPAVRDVLARRCVSCHGGEHAKSGLRLATAATFRAGGVRGPVVDARDRAASRLLSVIDYRDPDLAMPPSGRLPDAELRILRRWVLAGAPWPEGDAGRLADPAAHQGVATERDPVSWWAYAPLHAEPPAPRPDEHPVDAFIRRGLEARGLEPAPAAAPGTLIRRATFELVGLPPTPGEVRAFEEDCEGRGVTVALADLVDRLLARPGYGEHQARHWLDLVRYAETNGYERDATKTNAWRYRDWVIRALERDLPYDRFVIEQLAGDELPPDPERDPAVPDPRLATGYFRLGPWDDEPADAKQALADEIADVVDVTGQVFLGTTVGCARCHDHKADPISQEDYYGFTAWFANVVGHGGGRFGQALGGGVTRPIADPPGEGALTAGARDARLAALDEGLRPHLEALRAAVAAGGPEPASTVLVPDARREAVPWRYAVGDVPPDWAAPAFSDEAWSSGPAGFGREGTPGARIGTPWHGERIALRRRFPLLAIPDALVLSVHHDEDVAVWINGVHVFARRGYRTDYAEVQLPPEARSALVVGSNVLAVSCRQTGGGQFVDVGLRTGWLDAGDEAMRHRLEVEAERRLAPDVAARARELLEARHALLRQPVAEPYPAQVVVEHGGVPPVQHVLGRGSAHAPGAVVTPAIPEALRVGSHAPAAVPAVPAPAPDAPSSGRRLALARWIVGPGRHLAARVAANRLWQHHFGRGLCRTTGDFGRLGERPTHPRLLDHLAIELIRRGWSLKALHRYVMASAAWRRTSAAPDDVRASDPRNDLLARRDPLRLSAEQFRDAVLATCGALNRKRFGPSIHPPLPPEVLATASRPDAAWGRSSPEEAARRSVYVFVKRSLRMPLLEGLDQPDPDLPCCERFPTNVPTQALMTLNGAFVRRAAARLAARLEGEAPDLAGRIARGLELALGRAPAEGEVARHVAFVEDLGRRLGLEADAALRVFALAVFNLNEFLWID